MKCSKLTQIDFDNLENNLGNAMVTKEIGIFADIEKVTSHGKIAQWFTGKTFDMYLGWNGQVYPQFKIEIVNTQ